MARHHLIDNDLNLFLTTSASVFKKKISSRVSSRWQEHTNNRDFRFIHMILIHAIKLAKEDNTQSFDWPAVFVKLEEANYQFKSSDYFPSGSLDLFEDEYTISVYLSMIQALHVGKINIDQQELVKFLKKTGVIDSAITDFFTLIGFDLKSTLLEVSVEHDISTLTNSSFESVRFNPEITISCYNAEQLAVKLVEYEQLQQIKMKNIKDYLNSVKISEQRAKELYKRFRISYEKMETYPEFKGKFLADICIDYGMALVLKQKLSLLMLRLR